MKIFVATLLLTSAVLCASAQQERAVVIGIDSYAPPGKIKSKNVSGRSEWPNLEGCKNDAVAVKNEIVIRWGFKNENIRELYDSNATRKNILSEINRLFQDSKKGDIAFIYYAGHGSQVKNSKSPEQDKLDESIVPADAWKEGIEDLRDKTLSALINKFVDKGVILTTIFDCCHSGSMGRGFNNELPKFRYIKASNNDAMDPSDPPVPELRKEARYLAISASQENEPAQEQRDDNNIPHGAFTVALLKAMNQQSVDASISGIFSATRAILKSNGKKQEPVLAGSSQRLHGTLFGISAGILPDKTLIPLISVSDSALEFQGGFMVGLNIGNELTKKGGDVKVRIVRMLGANRSLGAVISGKPHDAHPGELFEVSNWVSSSAPFLKVYVPNTTLSFEDVSRISAVYKEAKQLPGLKLINDFERQDPDVNIYYRNSQWMLTDSGTIALKLAAFSLKTIADNARQRFLFINIPPPASLYEAIKKALASYRNIQLTDDPGDAQYILAGTINDKNQLCYSWVRSEASARDSLEPMPLQSRYFALNTGSAQDVKVVKDSLYTSSLKLSKIRAWLNLQVPAPSSRFPFHLEIRKEATNEIPGEKGIIIGDKLAVYLKAGDNFMSKWDRKKRFIYVFIISRDGTMSLVYPDENSGNLNNRYPLLDEKEQPLAETKLAAGEVTGPPGSDTYYLLATEEPIPDYSNALNQQGVRGSSLQNSSKNPLYDLLNLANPSERGLQKSFSDNWSLDRTTVKTHY